MMYLIAFVICLYIVFWLVILKSGDIDVIYGWIGLHIFCLCVFGLGKILTWIFG